jgi:outer membrane protein OmpA-like peptidoglycan-associated protein
MKNLDSRWGYEFILDLIPQVDGASGENPTRERLGGNIGTDPLIADTWGMRLGVDGNFHLRNIENLRWDPYLSLGVGYLYFDESVDGADVAQIYGGGGMMYHFNDAWAIRADAQVILAGSNSEFNAMYSIGFNYRPGTDLPDEFRVMGDAGNLDSDGDGLLTDGDEVKVYATDPLNPDTDGDGLTDGAEVLKHNTDPLNPDTDGDGLKDGAEVNTYKTDPLNPDTDGEGLTDGDEVHQHKTDPLNRDTDGGGVDDGHEVLVDGTDPLDPADDFIRIELKIEFDTDKATIRSADYDELAAVIKLIESVPSSTAVVEGHADKRPTSKRDYNLKLSERRANTVRQYLLSNSDKIDSSRISAKGYGFDRPLVPNDSEENMQHNRRVEVYINRNSPATD